jgi:hypothetical protein
MVFAVSVGKEAKVTHPYIASRQNMKKEPSDKLACLEGHGLLTVMVCIIPPSEGNLAVLEGEDAVITDGDPVGISAEVLKDTPGAIKGRFAIDDPLLMVELSPEGFEVAGIGEMTDTALEYKITRFEGMLEQVKELPSEQRRHDPHRNEEPFGA